MTDAIPQLTPRNLTEALEFCERLAKTSFVPDSYKNKPNEILAAIQYGAEVGIGPMQALQSIAVINGRPSLWGDVMLALCQASGRLEWIEETETADTAVCEVKRKGDPKSRKVTFSQADAVKAGLANKQGPWQTSTKRMRQMRARGFALRDKFADVLKGIIAREEAQDIPIDTTATVLDPPLDNPPPDNSPTGRSREAPSGSSFSHSNEGAKSEPKLTLKLDDEATETPLLKGDDSRLSTTAGSQAPITPDSIAMLTALWRSHHSGKIAGASEWLAQHFEVEDFAELMQPQVEECARLIVEG